MGPIADAPEVLVTGGGGFLGGAIVRRLVERGERVRTFSRRSYPELETLGVEQVEGDLADPEAVSGACAGIRRVFHTAAKPGVWGRYAEFHAANTTGTLNVLAACRRNGVERLIHTSSPSVVFDGSDQEGVDESAPYPEEFHAHYPHTKAMAEKAVVESARAGAVRAVALRPHLIWGPGDRHLVPRILARAKSLRRIGSGENRADTIYIDNAAEAHLRADEALGDRPEISGRVYFISQGEPVPLWDMVDAILAAGGRPPVRGSISVGTARRIGAALEWFYGTFGLSGEPRLTRFVVDELSASHWFDISAARRDLGYAPRVSTEEGLERLAAWLRETGQVPE
jgi:2-alkyl-3-oxoalkanoate reductase